MAIIEATAASASGPFINSVAGGGRAAAGAVETGGRTAITVAAGAAAGAGAAAAAAGAEACNTRGTQYAEVYLLYKATSCMDE